MATATSQVSFTQSLEEQFDPDEDEYPSLDDLVSFEDEGREQEQQEEMEDTGKCEMVSEHENMKRQLLDETFATAQEEEDRTELGIGLDSAFAVVSSLLEQITMNDSPPVNENVCFSPRKVASTSMARSLDPLERPPVLKTVSRQQHALSPSNTSDVMNKLSLSPTGAFVSSPDANSNLSSLGWQAHVPPIEKTNEITLLYQAWYQQSQSRAEMKMGNVALATLCNCTLNLMRSSDLVDKLEVAEPDPPVIGDENRKPKLRVDTGTPLSPKKDKLSATEWIRKKLASPTKKQSVPTPPKLLSPKVNISVVDTTKASNLRRNMDPPGDLFVTESEENMELNAEEVPDGQPPQISNLPTPLRPETGGRNWDDYEDNLSDGHHRDLQLQDNLMHSHSEDAIVEETNDDIAIDSPAQFVLPVKYSTKYTSSTHSHFHLLTVPPKHPRLQMFGSEYARFLSSTALAPDQLQRNLRTLKGLRQPTWRRTGQPRHRQYRSVGGDLSLRLGKRTLNIEDADNAVLTGAITDIIVTHGTEVPPSGYYRISQTADGDEFIALLRNAPSRIPGGRTTQVYINVKKEPNWDRAAQRPCVTALAIIFPDRNEFVPPGFCVVHRYAGIEGQPEKTAPANLSFGSDGERVYLCYRRSREGNPITGILPLQPSKEELIPEGYTVLERTPRNHVADINSKGGSPVFLAFRQRLASLEPLRPLPLLLSVYHDAMMRCTPEEDAVPESPERRLRSMFRRSRLQAYYCTGGTVVGCEVGLFHIMDRSTHPLLSPSSVSNRLSLIEASRQKTNAAIPNVVTPKSGYQSSNDSFAKSATSDVSMGRSTATNESTLGDYFESGRSVTTEIGLVGDADVSIVNSSTASSISNSSDVSSRMRKNEAEGCGASSEGSLDIHSSSSMSQASQLQQEGETKYPPRKKDAGRSLKSFFSTDNLALKMCLAVVSFIPSVKSAAGHSKQLDARAALLTPILTACYTHHGGASLLAVEGLTKLLKTTDFFSDDVGIEGSNARLTLLDLAIQAVCDVATSSSRETSFGACIEFVQYAIMFNKGQVNTRTVGYVLRFYLFVFYFGASIPSSSSSPNPLWTSFDRDGESCRSSVAAADVPISFEEFNTGGKSKYLPGGAPQAAVLALKEMVTLLLGRISSMATHEASHISILASQILEEQSAGNTLGAFISGIVSQLVDSAANRVDLANINQLAIHQIHRSGGSELFWYDMMTSCGSGLFGNLQALAPEMQNVFIINFALLANLVKVSSGKVRKMASGGSLISRDITSKMLSLELLLHFLERFNHEAIILCRDEEGKTGVSAKAIKTMAFSVRRLVVPCMLSNTAFGLQDARIFRRMMQIVSKLWRSKLFRRHMMMELGILIEHFGLGILQLDPQLLPPHRMHETNPLARETSADSFNFGDIIDPLYVQQIDVLFEIQTWFKSNSTDIVELYLNYDTDVATSVEGPNQLLPGTQWKLCQQLCGSTCALAEKAGDFVTQQLKASQKTPFVTLPANAESQKEAEEARAHATREAEDLRLRARQLQKAAIETAAEIMKSFAICAATSFGKKMKSTLLREKYLDELPTETKPLPPPRDQGDNNILNYWRTAIVVRNIAPPSPQKLQSAPSQQSRISKPHLSALDEESVQGSVVDRNRPVMDFSKSNATDGSLHAAFDIARSKSLKKAVDYLTSENLLSPSPRDIAAFLRIHHSKFDPTMLGEYLGEGGLEAEEEHWNLIRFNYVRAISFVGLNVEQGLRHFLTNCGFRLPGEAQRIDRIITTFSQCYWEDNAGDHGRCPFSDQDVVFLISFAIIMLNTDLHKRYPAHMKIPKSRKQRKVMTKAEFLNNLRGVHNNEELSPEYIGMIYDSIAVSPIELFDDNFDKDTEMTASSSRLAPLSSTRCVGKRELAGMLKSMLKNVRKSEELLRGLAVHEYTFYAVKDISKDMQYGGDEDCALSDLVQSALSTTWHHFHGVIESSLNNAESDPQTLALSLDILKFAVCATILLGMNVERTIFLTQFARAKAFSERLGARARQEQYLGEVWYRQLESALNDPNCELGNLSALAQIHVLFDVLYESLKESTEVKSKMAQFARLIRDGQFLLNDPSRSFIKEGELTKKGSKLGRSTKYHFFLFSDMLLYTKPSSSSCDYKIHDEFPLHMMKIVDWFPPSKPKLKYAFSVHLPRKSLLVFCSSETEKREWVKAIQGAIQAYAKVWGNEGSSP